MGRPVKEDTGIKQRLLDFIDHKKLSVNRFCTMCGFSSAYVRNIQKTISQRYLKIISKAFPDLNIYWLETGEGQMLNEVIPISVQNNTVGNNSQQTIFAGHDQKIITPDKKGQKLIEDVRKMSEENISLKAENTTLKTKVEMLTEQVEWLRTLVKQQQQ